MNKKERLLAASVVKEALDEIERLEYLHNLDHSLADQWAAQRDKALEENKNLSIWKDRYASLEIRMDDVKKENERLREFITKISLQKPEKPDYWSTCGQCDRNIDGAEEVLGGKSREQRSYLQE